MRALLPRPVRALFRLARGGFRARRLAPQFCGLTRRSPCRIFGGYQLRPTEGAHQEAPRLGSPCAGLSFLLRSHRRAIVGHGR